jgi:carbamoyl-phosphate synthase large subunit
MARILVTGVGAIIGYGVLRSLKDSGHHLIGMDIYADAYGRHLCPQFVQALPTADPAYSAFVEKTLGDLRPDLVIPCIEQDVACFDGLRDLFDGLGVACALNSSELIRLAADKWAFHQAEAAHGLAVIDSRLDGDFHALAKALGLPFLLKPRRGYAGKGIVTVASQAAFRSHQSELGGRFMAQRRIGSDDEEYTVGVFGDGEGAFEAQIQMRRLLSGEGATVKAWVVAEAGLTECVKAYCVAFKPIGPTNLQFRRDGETWALLEINPRISSSTSLRAAFGYNEAAMAVGYYLEGRLPEQPAIRRGHAVRYIEDHVVFDDRADF